MNLSEILGNLTQTEKVELYKLLGSDLHDIPELTKIKLELNKKQVVLCPHCKGTDIYGHGIYKGRKRYKCKGCSKTFNDFTGTAVSGTKKTQKFQEYLEMIVESVTIRKAANKIGVNTRTIFDWRHKLLSSLTVSFSGIVECDDKQLDIKQEFKT
jgi:transposase-like protein